MSETNLDLNVEIISAITSNPEIMKKLFEKKGYDFYTKGIYNVNNFGIRITTEGKDFNDLIGTVYKEAPEGDLICKAYVGTTDPGSYYLKNPMNKLGCAILAPGQYKGYKIDMHRGKYEALCQRTGTVKVYRDDNRDEVIDLDLDSIKEGMYGINIHKVTHSEMVEDKNKFSAGCQEIMNSGDYHEWMQIQHNAAAQFGNNFTYTLFELEDFSELMKDFEKANEISTEEE